MSPNADEPGEPNEAEAKTRLNWLVTALRDWMALLSGPPSPVFTKIVKTEDWKRLLRLLTLILILTSVILGITISIKLSSITDISGILLQSQLAIAILMFGVVLSVTYHIIAHIFGVKLSLAKSFFIVLCLALPWIPVIAVFELLTIPQIKFPQISLVYGIGPFFILIKPIINFYFGVSEFTNCAKWRITASIIVPSLLVMFLILFRLFLKDMLI